jgi:hypothetical protein
MAGFEVIMYGRFWVITEELAEGEDRYHARAHLDLRVAIGSAFRL